MRGRRAFVAALAVGLVTTLSFGLWSTPSGAATSTVTTAVDDGGTNAAWAGTEVAGATAYDTAVVTGDGTAPAAGTVTYSLFDNDACTGTAAVVQTPVSLDVTTGAVPNSAPTAALNAGSYSFQAAYSGDSNMPTPNDAGTSSCEPFTVAQITPTAPTISNIPPAATYGQAGFTAVVTTNGDGTLSVSSNSTSVCTASGLVVTYVSAGTCSLTPAVALGTNYLAATGVPVTFTIAQAVPTTPSITNLPGGGTYGGGFTATVGTNGDGTKSVSSNTPTICSTNGFAVSYVGAGTCSLNAQIGAGANYQGAIGNPQTFAIGRASATIPTISNIPAPAKEFFGFTPILNTTGDGTQSVSSSTPKVCSVGSNGITVSFVGFGTCTLTPTVATGPNYFGATGSPESFPVQEASHGYWLVGSDGGIFSFGTAAFHGSMGGTPLQRPVVAITPTSTGNGYWLVASDGGLFSFGDATYYGSLPGVGLHPAGSGLAHSLNAPIVGMVPSFTGHGYFMVASDGGVFAFGDAKFAGSCPGIGGCAGTAVAVMPDHTGNGYWLVTSTGAVYAFGDAAYYGGPTPSTVPVVDAVASRDGDGYWLIFANGVVDNFGDATNFGAPTGYVNPFNPATTIFPTEDDQGYWVASARGDVFSYGDSPFLGSMAAAGLNGEIIGAFGF